MFVIPAGFKCIAQRGAKVALVVLMATLAIVAGDVFAAVEDFSHVDDNTYSPRRNESVGPYDAINGGAVTMWYHQYNKG